MKEVLFDKILVANRGEIAVRVMRACGELGIRSVGIYSDADRDAIHTRYADEAHHIGPAAPTQSYLNLERIVRLATEVGAQAIHPGYGFLSERPEFPEACERAGIVFLGPPASAMRALGSKLEARALARSHGVPVTPGSEALEDPEEAARVAREIGFPVIVKPSGGGGGIGMKVVEEDAELGPAIESCRAAAQASFGDPTVYVERYVRNPRHIEVQVIADGHGKVVHLGERECSIQRRHQKILEETPSPVVTPELRRRMGEAAVEAARAAGYVNAGTVEFIFSEGEFYFLEVNTRLQVEHPITEAVTGVDLVKEQIRVGAGRPLSFSQEDVTWTGHAIEMRINAEDPARGFVPNPGRISRWAAPSGPGVRVDSGFGPGSRVAPNYDSLVAKLIVSGADRAEAIARAGRALREFVLVGPATTIPYHRAILENTDFRSGNLTTRFIDEHPELLDATRRFLDARSPMEIRAMPSVELFVNGTLMRGDVLHRNLDGATFVSEAKTASRYRLYSIGDVHPGMIHSDGAGVSVSGELYELDLDHLERLILSEPPGLGVGVVELQNGGRRLGIFWVAPQLPETAIDISEYGGWRAYRQATLARSEPEVVE